MNLKKNWCYRVECVQRPRSKAELEVGSNAHSNEAYGSIKGGQIVDQLSGYQILKKGSASFRQITEHFNKVQIFLVILKQTILNNIFS
jgi:hypothetical protein